MNPYYFRLRRLIVMLGLVCLGLSLLATTSASSTSGDNPPPPPERFAYDANLPRWPQANLITNTLATSEATNNNLHLSKITFQSYRDNNWEIYSGNADGSGQIRLTYGDSSDLMPRFNRGATRIAFASKRTGNYEIFTMNADGTNLAKITFNEQDDVMPAWSADGTKIAFESYRDGQAEVYVMNADGSNPIRLTYNSGYDGEPAWSPDGTHIAFTSRRTGGAGEYYIYVMQADGSNQIQLSTQLYSQNPTWSPSGYRIAYDAAGGDYWQNVWMMTYDGSDQRLVYDEPGLMDSLVRSWSPDEECIAFTRIYYTYYQGLWY